MGKVFSEIAAIDRGPRSASIEALRPTLVAVMSAADFECILRDDAEVCVAALRLPDQPRQAAFGTGL